MDDSTEIHLKPRKSSIVLPANPFLGTYLKEMMVVAEFTIAKNQPRCLGTDDWIKKLWHMYITDYYSAMKKNKILLSETQWM